MAGQPPTFDEDPAAAFLAQEQDVLGGLVDEIAPSQPQVMYWECDVIFKKTGYSEVVGHTECRTLFMIARAVHHISLQKIHPCTDGIEILLGAHSLLFRLTIGHLRLRLKGSMNVNSITRRLVWRYFFGKGWGSGRGVLWETTVRTSTEFSFPRTNRSTGQQMTHTLSLDIWITWQASQSASSEYSTWHVA